MEGRFLSYLEGSLILYTLYNEENSTDTYVAEKYIDILQDSGQKESIHRTLAQWRRNIKTAKITIYKYRVKKILQSWYIYTGGNV